MGAGEWVGIIEGIRDRARREAIRITAHAHVEMVEENIALAEVLEALDNGHVLEDYPEHRRGACCLISGRTVANRPLHVVCTSSQPIVVIITVYQPKRPKWATSEQRGNVP
jgi:hypothetical protein